VARNLWRLCFQFGWPTIGANSLILNCAIRCSVGQAGAQTGSEKSYSMKEAINSCKCYIRDMRFASSKQKKSTGGMRTRDACILAGSRKYSPGWLALQHLELLRSTDFIARSHLAKKFHFLEMRTQHPVDLSRVHLHVYDRRRKLGNRSARIRKIWREYSDTRGYPHPCPDFCLSERTMYSPPTVSFLLIAKQDDGSPRARLAPGRYASLLGRHPYVREDITGMERSESPISHLSR